MVSEQTLICLHGIAHIKEIARNKQKEKFRNEVRSVFLNALQDTYIN